jgi:AcrR family transcriptional regulator
LGVVSRPYRSSRREQAAELTRRAVLDAARTVFVDRGYAGATLAAIAEAADVAVPTVYASVGGKPALLMALVDDIDAQSVVIGSLASPQPATDAVEVVRAAVEVTRRINEQAGDVIAMLDAAARFEPEAAAAVEEGIRRHRAGALGVALRLDALGALRPGVDVHAAADTFSILTHFRVWRTLVNDYTWSWPTACAWITRQTRRSLLAESNSHDASDT